MFEVNIGGENIYEIRYTTWHAAHDFMCYPTKKDKKNKEVDLMILFDALKLRMKCRMP